ncbi:carboxypeptidase-like regulatory domain-containing protein [Hymenobacter psychrophilus]|uniref:TonB-dependent outer membrane receptor, SusC/RagA subfamily, signature region n=1 Tax=Hymenobacter psychrophilus TaxID=651662 RepID=A0A1H3BUL4_9BACT|nr:carboxypeptidase-like regulatory domain-containing protein [Hymenobacter psychrophilus]SDX44869.1 TonB-dependent outer membrane receptor, SusC/RagA subfamily, signature region [Hymenobacter psychrophilus]
MPLRLLLPLLLLLLPAGSVRAQQPLARARQQSYQTKVFRLTDAQARHLYERGLATAQTDFFAQPVDSFPTSQADSLGPKRLAARPPGYYLVARTEGPELVYWLFGRTDRQLAVLDNQQDLTLVLRDSLGRLLPGARLLLRGGRRVPFDAATQTYRLAGRAGRAGLLAVEIGGRTTYHALEQKFSPHRPRGGRALSWRGAYQRVLYGFPLGYLGRPVRRLLSDLRHASSVRTGPIGLLRAVFNPEVREQRQQQRAEKQSDQWRAYLVLSKPRYRPAADTLRLKARVLRRRGQPYRRPLELWLSADQQRPPRRLARLVPVRPGSYEFTLPLPDTLNLRSDQYVRLSLRPVGSGPFGPELATGSFRLEDYELNNTRYTLRPARTEQPAGAPQALFLRGQDANDLNLLDARVRLRVLPLVVGRLAGRQVFVPDTLWTHAQPLDAAGETRVALPDSVLPAADLTYQVEAEFLNADQERHLEKATVRYEQQAGQLTLRLRQDSLRADYEVSGPARPRMALLETTRPRPDGKSVTTTETVLLPLARLLDPAASRYRLQASPYPATTLALDASNAGLQLTSARTTDSLVLGAENPRRLRFWYYLYRGNRLVERGYGPGLTRRRPAPAADTWYVSVHYFWGGELRKAEYHVAPPGRRLTIEAAQPEVVYPGQRITLAYTVRDEAGRPVPAADLTAYAHTSKFAAPAAPEIPDFAPALVGRVSRRRLGLAAGFANEPQRPARQPLAWGAWRQRLGLDSLRFYQFLYPATGTFAEYQLAPGGITQLAPFVVDSGRVQPTVAVYIDGIPVFVGLANADEPFALVADTGRHTVAIRTPDRLITLRNVPLRHLHKLTLSIDPNHAQPNLTVVRLGAVSATERAELQRYLAVIDRAAPRDQLRLRQGNRLQVLGEGQPARPGRITTNYQYDYQQNQLTYLAGPFRPDSVLLRRASDGLRQRFLFEPAYRYTFGQGLLKMRSLNNSGFEYGDLGRALVFTGALPLADFALTEADLQPSAATGYFRAPTPEPVLDSPAKTPAGQGRLVVLGANTAPNGLSSAGGLPVLYTLLTRPDQPGFRRLLRYLPQYLHALPPGPYHLALLRADSSVLAPRAAVQVRAGGTTFLQLDSLDRQPLPEAAARRWRQLFRQQVAAHLYRPGPPAMLDSAAGRREIAVALPLVAPSGWHLVRGRVTDRATGEGLPGVTVLVKGTNVGVSTNADGSYALSVPPGGVLVFSSIGFVSMERPANGPDMPVELSTDSKQLSEVVVTGLGIERRRAYLASSVSTVESAFSGKVAGIQIRGSGTLAGSSRPLLIVDGLPFGGRLQDLNPDDILTTEMLKAESATAMYGSRAASGVILITTKRDLANGRPSDDGASAPGRDPRLALRRRFSDVGWWRPTLVTDQQGRAHTEVIVPDDLTGWDIFVLASDDHARTGSFTQRLRSFKALAATLATPRFLLQGDRPQVIGKTLNYLPDTAQVSTTFQVGAGPERTLRHRVLTAVLDTLSFVAPADADSVAVRYSLRRADGYEDGELRYLPVLPVGTRERVGTFAVLTAADTTLTLPVRPELGPVTLRLESDPVPVVLDEIRHLQNYAYLCNEQAASKLRGLLLEQRLRAVLRPGQPFAGTRDADRLIRLLLRGRPSTQQLWGTWATAPVSAWASLHVIEALLEAGQQGYRVALDKDALRQYLLRELDNVFADATVRRALAPAANSAFRTPDDRLRLLQLLRLLGGPPPDFSSQLARLEREPGRRALDQQLALLELRQQLGLPSPLDSLRRYRHTTALGGVFYADTLRAGSFYRYLLSERLGTTLQAYRLLRSQGGPHAARELARIRAYLLQQRGPGGHWASTYEAGQILATIGPDLTVPASGGLVARAQLSGGLNQQVNQFPFEATLPAGAGPLVLRKQGGLPVYATAYQTRWNPAPAAVATPFAVRTRLAGQPGSRVVLKAGQPAELEVTVEVPAEARYVLLEVPIPAGCSYAAEKASGNAFEVHREYLRHQVGIFIDVLPAGRHVFRVALQPRYRGRYTLNPARAELLYFPTRFGRAASRQAVVE